MHTKVNKYISTKLAMLFMIILFIFYNTIGKLKWYNNKNNREESKLVIVQFMGVYVY